MVMNVSLVSIHAPQTHIHKPLDVLRALPGGPTCRVAWQVRRPGERDGLASTPAWRVRRPGEWDGLASATAWRVRRPGECAGRRASPPGALAGVRGRE